MSDEYDNNEIDETTEKPVDEAASAETENSQYRMSFHNEGRKLSDDISNSGSGSNEPIHVDEAQDNGNYYNSNYNNPNYNNPNYNNYNSPDNGGNGKNNKNPIIGAIIAVLVLAALIGGFIGLSRLLGTDKEVYEDNKSTSEQVALNKEDETKAEETKKEDEKESSAPVVLTPSDIGTTGSVTATVLDVSGVVEEVMPSIVAVTNTTIYSSNGNMNYWNWYFNYGSKQDDYKASGAGSGVIIAQTETELMIATNAHVVLPTDYSSYGLTADSSDYEVLFCDDQTVKAYLKGYDEDMDLAVLVVKLADLDKDTAKAIKIATVGDSDKIKVGNGVIAIGNALGYGQSVTVGYISALNREITIDKITRKLIQTDAAINPGNSGGGLFDTNGRLVGINSAKYASTEVEGVGFAIPISEAENILEDIMNKETIIREKVTDPEKQGFLGITSEKQYSQAYDGQGAFVGGVVEGGAAEKAGIMAYDIITAIGDVEVKSWNELLEELSYYEGGETVEVTYYTLEIKGGRREYVEKKADVTLGFKKDYEE